MQAASTALSNTFQVVVAEKLFESTLASLRELPLPESGVDASTLRRGYTTSIKRLARAQKQIEDTLAAISTLEDKDAEAAGAQQHASQHAPPPKRQRQGRPAGRPPKHKATDQRSAKAVVEKPPKRQYRKHVQLVRPPHIDRAPIVGEAVAARIASHDHWILATVVQVPEQLELSTSSTGGSRIDPAQPTSSAIYVVRDYSEPTEFRLERARLLTLPMAVGDDLEASQWLGPGVRVMAMYPSTTAFYIGTLHATSAGGSCTGGGGGSEEGFCVVNFDDDEGDDGLLPDHEVPIRFVTLAPGT